MSRRWIPLRLQFDPLSWLTALVPSLLVSVTTVQSTSQSIMTAFPWNGLRKVVAVVLLSLVVFSVLHLLSYADDFAVAGPLSQSIDIIDRCAPAALDPLNDSQPNVGSGIPNIVHQVWKTADVRTYSTDVKASHESWKAMLEPLNYTVKLWTDDDVLQLVKSKYAWLLLTYEGYPQNIQRADVARLVVVHAQGGMYADLDVYPSSAVQIQCLQHLGLQAIFAPTTGTLGLSNHFFMAERGSSFLQWALYEAKRRGATSKRILLPYLQVHWSTGPMMVTSAFRKYAWLYSTLRQDLGLLDGDYTWSVIEHAAGRSWHGSDGQVLNYIADHVRVNTLLTTVTFLGTVLGLACVWRRCGRPLGSLVRGCEKWFNKDSS
ncbi:Glycosyltransferase, DXD sugar-binding region [Tolypocladium paradoxum]|uniref:Glycosyltransferase, DXD sugar-binding region n=1 Tax=Tolypocladium paradoxum TaxID=94208 RepID=A0A2S4KQM9_9HYPO|nr:Glycosyltransferase, DXD sugar-binding region [Tolypocladium paradoxum]